MTDTIVFDFVKGRVVLVGDDGRERPLPEKVELPWTAAPAPATR
jgi:hypothetical protein